VAIFIASKRESAGAVARAIISARLQTLADRFGFISVSDECYSEIYTTQAPGGMLECSGSDVTICGLRSIRCRAFEPAGHAGRFVRRRQENFSACFTELRHVAAPPVPVARCEHSSIAAYSDERVRETARLYRSKFDLADQIRGTATAIVAPRRLLRSARRIGPRGAATKAAT